VLDFVTLNAAAVLVRAWM